MSGKKDLVVVFMLAIASIVPLAGCSEQEQETSLKVADKTIKVARDLNTARTKFMSEAADVIDKTMDKGPPSQITEKDVPKYLSERIRRRFGNFTMLKHVYQLGLDEGMPESEFWNDGKCLGYMMGKTSGDEIYGDADIYTLVNGEAVRIYREPSMKNTVKAFGNLIDAALGVAGETINDLQEEQNRRRKYSLD